MRILLAVVLFFLTSLTAQSSPETPKQKTPNPQQTAPADQRGTEQLPAVVKILPTPKTAEETEADRKERAEKADSDWALVKLTGALAIVGALQLLVFGYQAWKLRQTVQAAAHNPKTWKNPSRNPPALPLQWKQSPRALLSALKLRSKVHLEARRGRVSRQACAGH
jgi:hypothetical protein